MHIEVETLPFKRHPTEDSSALLSREVAIKRWVYIVDDDSMVRRSVSFALRAAGYDVRAFLSGRDFLEEVDVLAPGCVLLDMRMPELDGIAVLEELADRIRRLPVVMITGHGDVDLAVKAMKRGATDFLEKPFSDAALLEVLGALFALLPARATADRERLQAKARVSELTPRERDILQGLVAGFSNKVMANRFALSARTVEMHRSNLMARLGAGSLSDVVRLAMLAGVEPLGRADADT